MTLWLPSVIFFVNFFSDKLSADKVLVDAVESDQLVMSAAFHDLAMLHHDDLVCVANRAQSVRHHHDGLLA